MENIIINERANRIRSIARNALKNNWLMVVLGIAVYYILGTVVNDVLSSIFDSAAYSVAIPYGNTPYTFSFVSWLYRLAISGPLAVGLASFMLAFFRNKDINPAKIFDGFEIFIKTLGLFIIYVIFVALWSLLLIVPGIIAGIRYSQCFYIMADNPKKGIFQCINESKQLMNNNKGRYFYLGLTFIGWEILSSLPVALYSYNFGTDTVIGYIINLILTIPSLFVLSYYETSSVVFYEIATGHLVAETKPIE